MKIGATYSENCSEFVVWAPHKDEVSLVLPLENQLLKMKSSENGYWRLEVKGIKPNTPYLFRLNNRLDGPTQPHIFNQMAYLVLQHW